MSFASRYATASTPVFDYAPKADVEYLKPSELVERDGLGTVYTINALYVNTRGKYGESAVIACDGFNLNAPSHTLDDVKSIRSDGEAVDMINAGTAGFTLYEYVNRYGTQIGLLWCDVEQSPM